MLKKVKVTAIALSGAALAILGAVPASAADTGWIYSSTSSNTVDGCSVGGYHQPSYAYGYEKTSCSGSIGLKSKYVDGGTYWISGLKWGSSTVTISNADTFAHKVYH